MNVQPADLEVTIPAAECYYREMALEFLKLGVRQLDDGRGPISDFKMPP